MRPIDMKARKCAAVAVAALAAAVLGGCAAGPATPGGSATATMRVTAPGGVVQPSPSASESPSTFPENDPTFLAGGTVTVSGTVQQGAEPGCLILQSEVGQLELLSPTPTPHEGDHVTVTGHVVKAMSHCMQGHPFRVEKLSIG
ncbi:MAG: hypothetical protein M3P23_15865 [Actinomycetota bacterium]|nr:hypothetical protein [Actinomycetota bacterium]